MRPVPPTTKMESLVWAKEINCGKRNRTKKIILEKKKAIMLRFTEFLLRDLCYDLLNF